MKLLQKILFVAMVGIFGWNTDVRGLQFSDPRHAGGGANPNIVAVGGGGALAGLAAGVVAPHVGDNYVCFDINAAHDRIYFPVTGIQPPANLIGRLARANVDVGNVNSPVTKWYVEAFGGNAAMNEAYAGAHPAVVAIALPQMGSAVPIAAANIISANMGALNLNQEFWQEFRAIASTVAGRELLYRILIEIRRIDTAHANQHCYASGTERVGGMSLTVTHHAEHSVFVNKGSITFDNAHRARLQGVLEQYYSFLTTLVDFPANTPHHAGENIIGVQGATTANDQFTHAQIPLGGEHNADIHFPIDGHQPTTANAVAWSCANIDNRENSPITIWYMQMFGVIPINHAAIAAAGGGAHAPVYVQAGWDNVAPPAPHTPHRIINYGFMEGLAANLQLLHGAYIAILHALPPLPTLNGIAINAITAHQIRNQNKEGLIQFVNLLENAVAAAVTAHAAFANHQPTKKALGKLRLLLKQMTPDETVGEFSDKLSLAFKKNFRKIASTSVGRTLLYRILIEIRRHAAGGNVGTTEIPIVAMPAFGGLVALRNSLRRLFIDFDNFLIDYSSGSICVENSFSRSHYGISNISGIGVNGKYDGIARHEYSVDVSLFHEMNHWYHALRNIQRLSNEINQAAIVHGFDSVAVPAVVGAYYWGGFASWVNRNISESKWGINRPNYEEIRNIFGVPVVMPARIVPNPINGDDLSENLYRMCTGIPLRFGHVNHGFSFYEDSRVVDKVIESCTLQKAHYNCIPLAVGVFDRSYGDGRKGLGSGEF